MVKFVVQMIKIRDDLPHYAEETESFVRFNFAEIKECESAEKMSPLLLAVKFDHFDIFEYLVSLGCNPFVSCTLLMNPLHYAIENQNMRFVDRIMQINTEATHTNMLEEYSS